MRANYSPDIPDGDLPIRMNPSSEGGAFGVIDLGSSDICLDDAADARRLLAAAAKIVAWFETTPAPHQFESMNGPGLRHGPCLHCGHLKSNWQHAAAEAKRLLDPPAPGCASRSLVGTGCVVTESHWLHQDRKGHKWLSPESDPGGDERHDTADDEDAQRAADLQAHVSGRGGPSPAQVGDDAAGVSDDGQTYSDVTA